LYKTWVVPPWYIVFSGIVGAPVGAIAALASQFLAHRLAETRERKGFQVQSFERFRREFTEDPSLRNISTKKEPLTDDEIDEYLGLFEEVGLYFHRDLVDVELVHEILGDDIIDSWEDSKIREPVGAVRCGEDDPTYFKYFERLGRYLIRLRDQRVGKGI
jgi:hypothetical protein